MPAADMLVKLYEVQEDQALLDALKRDGITIRRAIPANMHDVTAFAREQFSEGWASEATAAMAHDGCFIAVKDHKIIGFACIEAMKDYFGPTGVMESERGKRIGKALLLRSLVALRERGYAYAIIGYVGDAMKFYEKVVNATAIPDSIPGHYGNHTMF